MTSLGMKVTTFMRTLSARMKAGSDSCTAGGGGGQQAEVCVVQQREEDEVQQVDRQCPTAAAWPGAG